jgi:hypothetical protein
MDEDEKAVKGTAMLLGLWLICAAVGGATHWYIGVGAAGFILIAAAIVA